MTVYSPKTSLLASCLFMCGCAAGLDLQNEIESQPIQILLEDSLITYSVDNSESRPWNLTENFEGFGDGPFSIGYVPYEDGYAVVSIEVSGEKTPICFEWASDKRCLSVSADRNTDLEFIVADQVYPVRIRARTENANFDAEYRTIKANTVSVSVPAFSELLNVAISLTSIVDDFPDVVPKNTDYYRRVEEHFGGFRGHPVISRLNIAMTEEPRTYYFLRASSLTYELKADLTVAPSNTYLKAGFPGAEVDELSPYVADLQSFARETEFLEFMRVNEPEYASQVAFFEKEVNVGQMLQWLSSKFPDAKSPDHINIVLSPLAGSVQFLNRHQSNGFFELQPHINYPYRGFEAVSEPSRAIARGTFIFTEINHGFIEPDAELLTQLNSVFYTVSDWIDAESDAFTTYGEPHLVFDEYLNWALASLYAKHFMPEADWHTYRTSLVRIMENGRGFIRFGEFEEEFVELYQLQTKDTAIPAIYPALLDWAAAVNNETSQSRRSTLID